jgi:hypothetical protein
MSVLYINGSRVGGEKHRRMAKQIDSRTEPRKIVEVPVL